MPLRNGASEEERAHWERRRAQCDRDVSYTRLVVTEVAMEEPSIEELNRALDAYARAVAAQARV